MNFVVKIKKMIEQDVSNLDDNTLIDETFWSTGDPVMWIAPFTANSLYKISGNIRYLYKQV